MFAALLSEKEQVALHTGWLVMFPAGVNVMCDRGFRLLQRFYPQYVGCCRAGRAALLLQHLLPCASVC